MIIIRRWEPFIKIYGMDIISSFGLLQRGGKVYAKTIPNAGIGNADTHHREKSSPDSIVYTDCWQGYNALDVSLFKHDRINRSVLI